MSSHQDAYEAPSTTTFRVGKGIGIVSGTTLALLEPINGALAERLWELVESGAGVDDLLEEFSTTGLRSLGSFALAQFEGSVVRIVVRGSGRADVVTNSTSRHIAAQGMRTWVEEVLEEVSSVGLCLADPPVEALPFRVQIGLLPADALQRGASTPASLTSLDSDWIDAFRAEDVILESTPLTVMVPQEADPMRTIASSDFDEREPSTPEIVETKSEGEYDYDAIYGRTVSRSVESAAVHRPGDEVVELEPPLSVPPAPPLEPPPSPTTELPPVPEPPFVPGSMISGVPMDPPGDPPRLGDHDGLTVTKAQIQAMRAARDGAPAAPQQPPVAGMGGPTVQAVLCASQHPNPPQFGQCRVCGAPLSSTTVLIARPPLGTLRFSTGTIVVLDRPVLVGRNPKLEGSLSSEIPHLVKLDVGQGLSRTHASVKPEGWQVLLEDLNSANGTTVTLPGRTPRRLHAGEPVLLEVGTHIDFGGEISCVVEPG